MGAMIGAFLAGVIFGAALSAQRSVDKNPQHGKPLLPSKDEAAGIKMPSRK